MVALVARQGRELQRYTSGGHRLVVGCIPYRFKVHTLGEHAIAIEQALEVLVISSQKGQEIMFPRGGWEIDESVEEAASREAMEEAGVHGNVENELGRWWYESKSQDSRKRGIMFPLKVSEELLDWPEMGTRMRRWVTVAEVREFCRQPWMKEALERLLARFSTSLSFENRASPLSNTGEQPRQNSIAASSRSIVATEETQVRQVDHELRRPNSDIDHIKDAHLSEDLAEPTSLVRMPARSILIDEQYWRSFALWDLDCLTRGLIRLCCYWLIGLLKALDFVQKFCNQRYQPASDELLPIIDVHISIVGLHHRPVCESQAASKLPRGELPFYLTLGIDPSSVWRLASPALHLEAR